ncbi:MAG: hypothetical protein OIF32_10045 [Campylobacterales bacterium]|nr:hypothetical protein [Campylobacterales bacterium]
MSELDKKKVEEKSVSKKLLDGDITEIEVEISVIDCIDNYLRPYSKRIEPMLKFADTDRRLDFLLMKRFLYTAFNNLLEMDLMMSNPRVLSSKKRLDEIMSQYNSLQIQINKPIDISYEKIFLEPQKHYSQVRAETRSKLKTADIFKSKAISVENRMKVLKEDIEKNSEDRSKKEIEALEKDYRVLNGKMTDFIHNMATLRDQVVILNEHIMNFETNHKISFSKVFLEEAVRISDEIVNVLDGIAYEFDHILWEEAKESKVIRKFFEEAHIEGSFSSKTYLKYYLKNISDETQNKEHKELRKLLEYLEKFSTRSIYILGMDNSVVTEDRVLLEAHSKEYKIMGSSSVDKFFIDGKKNNFDLIIIDYELKHEDPIKIIEHFWKKHPLTKNKTKILMRFRQPTYKDLDRAGMLGIKYFYRVDPLTKEAFAQKVMSILS